MSTSGSALLVIDLPARRALAERSPRAPFASLADGLARELDPLISAELPIPDRKARLTRHGGRCPEHGVFLDFDPWSPHDHRCARCDRAYQDSKHDDWWAMGAQLWTAERAAHAAALFALRGDVRHGELAARILRAYADRYHTWPNADNVLGPSRPFFSTYLESIWLLNLCHALALLEGRFDGWTANDGSILRAKLIEPSASLIDSYNEGGSNRQVWNEVAICSTWCLLGREGDVRRRLDAQHGIRWQIANGIDEAGSWYEGENYHLFAHRGLWYGVQLMRALNEPLAPALDARYSAGFIAPFAGLLPDDTMPSRNDSQYASSIRQWRTAEWCDLGWAHTHDRRIAGILSRLYDGSVPRRDTGRDRSTADAERNTPASALTRTDLSWRALLMADAESAPIVEIPATSICLPAQGLAVIRRDLGRTYVALEGGQLGGGHGHPDQLALTLQTGDARWLDDPGTGSYVEAELAWYRSTLAHAAPQFDHRSQEPVAATLLAFEDTGEFGWMVKQVDGIAEGVLAERAIVVGDGYLIDVLYWHSEDIRTLELPIAGKADMIGVPQGWIIGYDSMDDDPEGVSPEPDPERSSDMLELRAHPAFAHPQGGNVASRARTSGREPEGSARVWYALDPAADPDVPATSVMRALVPAAPWHGITHRHWIIAERARGRLVGVWSWPTDLDPEGVVSRVQITPGAMPGVLVTTHDGVTAAHWLTDAGWNVELDDRGARRSVSLSGFRHEKPAAKPQHEAPPTGPRAEYLLASSMEDPHSNVPGSRIAGATVIDMGESHYVRTEQSWMEAGAPTATVQIMTTPKWLVVDVHARTGSVSTNVPDELGRLDNEHMDVNADGLQWYMGRADFAKHASPEWHSAMLHVPRDRADESGTVRSTELTGNHLKPLVESTVTPEGWAMRLRWPRNSIPVDEAGAFLFEMVVNERPPERERRRGQLVLSGGGGFGYLAGSRRPANRFVRLVMPPERTKTTMQ